MMQNRGENDRKGFAREFADWMRRVGMFGRMHGKNSDHAPYRKCPSCDEPKFRISDRQRARPELYLSRTYRVNWLCLSCGKCETEIVDDP